MRLLAALQQRPGAAFRELAEIAGSPFTNRWQSWLLLQLAADRLGAPYATMPAGLARRDMNAPGWQLTDAGRACLDRVHAHESAAASGSAEC